MNQNDRSIGYPCAIIVWAEARRNASPSDFVTVAGLPQHPQDLRRADFRSSGQLVRKVADKCRDMAVVAEGEQGHFFNPRLEGAALVLWRRSDQLTSRKYAGLCECLELVLDTVAERHGANRHGACCPSTGLTGAWLILTTGGTAAI